MSTPENPMDLPENKPIADKGDEIRHLYFKAVSARLSNEFGDLNWWRIKPGDKPKQLARRGIYLVIEPDTKMIPRGGCLLGPVAPSDSFTSPEGAVRLDSLSGTCWITPRLADPDGDFAVGFLAYHEGLKASENHPEDRDIPAAYSLEIHLPGGQYSDILANLRIGRLPGICVHLRGLTLLGFGDEYYWDTKSHEKLPVTYFNTDFVTVVDYTLRKERRPNRAPEESWYFSPNKADMEVLLKVLNTHSQGISELTNKLRLIGYGMLALIGLGILYLVLRS